MLAVALALLSGLGLLLCVWIVAPPPSMQFLPLVIGSNEMSPSFLICWMAVASLSVWLWLGDSRYRTAAVLSSLNVLLCCWPLVGYLLTREPMDKAMINAFGPEVSRVRQRPRFSLRDQLQGLQQNEPIRIQKAIQFAQPDGKPLKLDLFQPSAPGNHPAVIVIYGGGWSGGSPEQCADISAYLAAQGYTVANIDYRHAPQYRFPAQLEDVRAATTYVQSHWQPDPTRIALLGRSSGAHLAMLAAYMPGAPKFAGVVDLYGPVDLAEGYRDLPRPDPINAREVLATFLGGTPSEKAATYRDASPITYVSANAPPTLIIHGSRDHIVKAEFSRQLASSLRKAGAQVALLELPWSDHAFDMLSRGLGSQLTLFYIERFLALRLKPAPSH